MLYKKIKTFNKIIKTFQNKKKLENIIYIYIYIYFFFNKTFKNYKNSKNVLKSEKRCIT